MADSHPQHTLRRFTCVSSPPSAPWVVCMALGFTVAAQDMPKAIGKKITHTLPPGFSKLSLDATQKATAYKIVDEHRTKINEALSAAQSWRTHERSELMKLLTPAQRDQLLKMSGLDFAPEPAAQEKK